MPASPLRNSRVETEVVVLLLVLIESKSTSADIEQWIDYTADQIVQVEAGSSFLALEHPVGRLDLFAQIAFFQKSFQMVTVVVDEHLQYRQNRNRRLGTVGLRPLDLGAPHRAADVQALVRFVV